MRRSTGAAALLAAATVLVAPAGAGSADGVFAPKKLTISRTSFAGITPKMSFAQVKAQWGRSPGAAPRVRPGEGRSTAVWGNYFFTQPTAAVASYIGRRPGSQPFRYTIHLAYSRELGLAFRTNYGDRAGATVRQFRRHWPNARRIPAGGGDVRLVAQSAYRGWRLAFYFSNDQLTEAELVTGDFVETCYVRKCRVYPAGSSAA